MQANPLKFIDTDIPHVHPFKTICHQHSWALNMDEDTPLLTFRLPAHTFCKYLSILTRFSLQ